MELDERFADRVADLCYKKYQSLPKKGKPQKNKEWTLLSCVCLTRTDFCIAFFLLKLQVPHYILFIIAIKLWPICIILSHLAQKELLYCSLMYCFMLYYLRFYQNNSAIYTVDNINVYMAYRINVLVFCQIEISFIILCKFKRH